jgi:hypothetical protein
MSLFDSVKQKAADLAGDAERAGKTGAAQVKLKSLEGDADKAKRDLGADAYALIKAGELSHPSLDHAVAAVDAAMAAIAAKNAEIEAIKGGASAEPTADAAASAVPPSSAVPPASATGAAPYTTPPGDQPGVQPYTTPSEPAGPAT